MCRHAVIKAKAQFKFKVARLVENYKKEFFRYINKARTKGKHRPTERRGELVTNTIEKAEVPKTYMSAFATSITYSQSQHSSPNISALLKTLQNKSPSVAAFQGTPPLASTSDWGETKQEPGRSNTGKRWRSPGKEPTSEKILEVTAVKESCS